MTTTPSLGRPEGLHVTYRRMRFDFEDGFDRYWHGGSAFRSLFWTQLSTAFQPGERFFIDSARAMRHTIDDPGLHEELAEFCRQEGHHTAQHLKLDRMNEEMGLAISTCRGRYERWLGLGRRILSPIRMLGITCALEHFTSGFADLWHRQPSMSEGGDPRVLALWSWHAAEEAEHRATCYDIYLAAGGGYFTRISTLFTAWSLILAISVVNTFDLLRRDGQLFTWDTLRGIAYLFGPRGIVTGLFPTFVRYFRPGFHPWHEPEAVGPEEIRAWQEQNRRYIVNLDQVEASLASAPAAVARAT